MATHSLTEPENSSERTREHETLSVERHVEVLLSKIYHRIIEGNLKMASDFAKLSAAIDAVATEITNLKAELASALAANGADQATIDALTAKLTALEPVSTAPGTAPAATDPVTGAPVA